MYKAFPNLMTVYLYSLSAWLAGARDFCHANLFEPLTRLFFIYESLLLKVERDLAIFYCYHCDNFIYFEHFHIDDLRHHDQLRLNALREDT